MVSLVHDEDVRDLQDSRLVHLDGVTHTRHDHDGGRVDMFPDRHVALTGSDGLDDDIIEPGSADEFQDSLQSRVVLTDHSKTSVEDVFIHRVEVDSKPVTEQGSTGDRAHGVEGDHGETTTTLDQFGGHAGHQCRFTSPG
ncbi:MAG: hypothetical protein CMJ36_00905 [Phycisphaerae bacterium]|nr:hypothetical protein [Phycisphaerae bacterium]